MTRQGRNDLHKLDVYRCSPQLCRAVTQIVAGFPRGEKERVVALDCVEIDEMAPLGIIIAAQDLADRIAAMLTKLIRSAEVEQPSRGPWAVGRGA